MIDTMFGALFGLVSSPHIMGLMLIAVIFGLLVGVTPGIGGKLSIAMAIPFVYGMDMVAGAVFLLTMHAVNGTSGQISSIMFGIPGDGDDAAFDAEKIDDGEVLGDFRQFGEMLADLEARQRGVDRAGVVVVADHHLEAEAGQDQIPSWVQDYALFLLDVSGRVVDWYSGAARIYGYSRDEATGKHVSFLYPGEGNPGAEPQQELNRSAAEGHFGNEGWHVRKGGSRFWANVITTALRDETGELQGFARVVRDFSERHERDEKLRRARARVRPVPSESTIAGIVSGEFDHIPEANDAFLNLVGYSREDVRAGRLHWPDLTPPEYAALDDLAHEEGLRFGACTPYEKELLRKDGTRVPVLVATAVLKLCPFRWITFIQDLRERDQLAWSASRLQLVDLQYSDVRPDKGLYNRLVERGRMARLSDEDVVRSAMTEPPQDTRAYFRGRCIDKFPDAIAAASPHLDFLGVEVHPPGVGALLREVPALQKRLRALCTKSKYLRPPTVTPTIVRAPSPGHARRWPNTRCSVSAPTWACSAACSHISGLMSSTLDSMR